MALPCGTTGSLSPSFLSARLVGLTVKLPYAFALYARFPTALREPLESLRYSLGGDRPSQTARLTLSQTRLTDSVRTSIPQGWYFKDGSTEAGAPASKPPTYPTHEEPKFNAKLQ